MRPFELLAPVAVGTGLLFPGDATAGALQSLGANVTVDFGERIRPGLELEWSLRRATAGCLTTCTAAGFEPSFSPGVAARGSWLGGDRVGAEVVARLGAFSPTLNEWPEPASWLAPAAEIGGSLRAGQGVGAIVGGSVDSGTLYGGFADCYGAPIGARSHPWHAGLRAAARLERSGLSAVLGVGGRFAVAPTIDEAHCTGRPLRVGLGRRHALVSSQLRPEGRELRLLRDGRDELSAVSAFLRLRAELADVGAPMEFLIACERAAAEELGHALMCLGLAASSMQSPVYASAPMWRPRRHPTRRHALQVLKHESAVDGVLGEAESALDLRARARHARGREADYLGRIAEEESTHALLAEDIADWCCEALRAA